MKKKAQSYAKRKWSKMTRVYFGNNVNQQFAPRESIIDALQDAFYAGVKYGKQISNNEKIPETMAD